MTFQSLLSGLMGFLMTISMWLGISHKETLMLPPLVPIQPATLASQAIASSATSSPDATNGSASVLATTSAAYSYPTGSAWMTTLPLGDSDYVTAAPKKGYIYLCNVMQGGEGAQGTPTWISGNEWYPSEKVAVGGSVSWPSAYYSMSISGVSRIIKSNGLPTDHDTGIFPIRSTDPAYQFDRNPNTIEAQDYDYTLPADPATLSSPDCIYGQVGIMNDGVPLFDGFDAEYRDAVAHETQDEWYGHPDQGGVYHNHGYESGPVKESLSTVVGFAFDGYPITGSLLPSGNYLHTADLDECHGITSPIELDGKTVTTYHYVLTQDFPYSVSCFRGTSYEPKPGGGASPQQAQGPQQGSKPQGAQGGTPPAPPQAAISACTGKSSGAVCIVNGGPSGTCATIGSYFACKPQ